MGYFCLQFDEYKKHKEEVFFLIHNYLASGRIGKIISKKGKYV
jgi:predicted RNA-binding protein YlqC (UPF0109 family)